MQAAVPAIVETLEARLTLSASSVVPANDVTAFLNDASLSIDVDAYADSRVLLQFRDETPTAEIDRLLSQFSTDFTEMAALQVYAVDLQAGISVDQALAWYRDSTYVMQAEPDYQLTLDAVPLPTDTFWTDMWGLNNTGQNGGTFDADIDAFEAWQTTTGNRSIIVAVIDSGIDYTHPDLAANIWINADEIAGNGVDDDGNGYIDDIRGYDFANNDADPMDDNGHGSHVAGTIGAIGNNWRGIAGVAWNVTLMPLKFLDAQGSGFVSDAVRAIDYAVANGAQISNNSWSGGGYSTALFQAISRAKDAGHLFVAAAGNNGVLVESSPSFPAALDLDNILSVAATDRNDQMASFSNYSQSAVDLAAPGVSIVSTFRGGGYAIGSGTSMAAPHVAGVAALVWGLHPEWNYEQVLEQVMGTVDPLSSLEGLTSSGGRLNAARAVGAPVFAADDHGNRDTVATLLTSNVETAGRIENSDDQDWFRLSVQAGEVIEFSMQAVTLDSVRLRLYDRTGGSHLGTFSTPVGTAGKWNWTADRTGTIYVQITSPDNLGSYRLQAGSQNLPPVLDDRTFTVAENSPNATVIATLAANDPNGSNGLKYTIVSGNASNAFSLDQISGVLRVNNSARFDYETRPSFQLNVAVTDAGGLTDNATITVQLTNVNEAPVLNDTVFYLLGNTPAGTKIGQLRGIDPDAGSHLTYSLVDNAGTSALASQFSIDPNTGWVTVNSSLAGLYAASSDMVFTVKVTDNTGLSDSATVQITPMVSRQGSTLTLRGSDADEKFLIRFFEGDLLVTCNGISDRVVLNGQPTVVMLDAGGGADELTIQGTAADESAVLRGKTVDWTGPQVRLLGDGIELITLKSGGGTDRAELYDSPGNDAYVGTPDSALWVGSDFKHQVLGFYRVAVFADQGDDRARFYDSSGDETFVGYPQYAVMTGNTFYQAVSGFERVSAYMTTGYDRAKLYDSAGSDQLTMDPAYVQMNGPGYYYYLNGFDRADAWSHNGGVDRVQMFDSADKDSFTGTATYALMSGATFYNYASGFTSVAASSHAGGLDRAKLYDTAGHELFTGTLNNARWQGSGFDYRLSGFNQVVVSTTTGVDRFIIDDLKTGDAVMGRGSIATVTSALAQYRFEGLDYLGAHARDGQQPIYDVEHIDYIYEKFGTWLTRAGRTS
ncbi:MAG: S8 family serine peptidase [Planctomycetaceae bacterium]